jgi:biotin operon repressor
MTIEAKKQIIVGAIQETEKPPLHTIAAEISTSQTQIYENVSKIAKLRNWGVQIRIYQEGDKLPDEITTSGSSEVPQGKTIVLFKEKYPNFLGPGFFLNLREYLEDSTPASP